MFLKENNCFVCLIYFIYSISGMGRYVYIDKDSKKGRFGIGVGVFQVLADEALTRVPDLVSDPIKESHHRKLRLNNAGVEIHRGVVHVKISVNAKSGADIKHLENIIVDEINTSFMMVAEQLPVEVKVKVENII